MKKMVSCLVWLFEFILRAKINTKQQFVTLFRFALFGLENMKVTNCMFAFTTRVSNILYRVSPGPSTGS